VILASPGQPDTIINFLGSHFGDDNVVITSDLPVDFAFWGSLDGQSFKILLERKKCPEDLYASWRDGRLRRQCLEMATNPGPNYLILEGNLTYDDRFKLRSGRYRTDVGFEMLTGLFLTCTVSGVWPLFSPNEEGTARLLITAYNYFQKQEHHSLITRGKLQSPWGKPGKSDLVLYLFQGFPGLGPNRAKWAWATAGSFRNFANLSADAMQAIPEFGPKISKSVTELLDMKCPASIVRTLK